MKAIRRTVNGLSILGSRLNLQWERAQKYTRDENDGETKMRRGYEDKEKSVDSQAQLIREADCIICHGNATEKFPGEYT